MAPRTDESAAQEITRGLTDRLRTILLSLDRRDRLESAEAFVGWLSSEREQGRLPGSAREMLLRALKVAADPLSFKILSRLDPLEASGLADLMELTGLSRVATSERVHDLVQTGLATREMISDQIRGTSLSAGLVGWIEEIARRSGEQLAAELADLEPTPDNSKGASR